MTPCTAQGSLSGPPTGKRPASRSRQRRHPGALGGRPGPGGAENASDAQPPKTRNGPWALDLEMQLEDAGFFRTTATPRCSRIMEGLTPSATSLMLQVLPRRRR